jgi:hypothetical protein
MCIWGISLIASDLTYSVPFIFAHSREVFAIIVLCKSFILLSHKFVISKISNCRRFVPNKLFSHCFLTHYKAQPHSKSYGKCTA